MHGNQNKYDELVKIADEFKPDVVINGGDMFPKNMDLHKQDVFIKNKLHEHFKRFEQLGIHYLCCLGNDDLKIFDVLFQEECSRFEFVHDIARKLVTIIYLNWKT